MPVRWILWNRDWTAVFFRCHRSYLVNLDYVVGKEPGMALLADGGRVYVARRKQQEFAMRLLEWCRKGE